METTITLAVLTSALIMAFTILAIKFVKKVELIDKLNVEVQSIANQKQYILKDYGNMYNKCLIAQKEIKRLNALVPFCQRSKKVSKDLNTAINEMNKHSDKRVIDELGNEIEKGK